MARKRQLDPDFFADEEIAEFPYEGRLFYQGTWCICEDTGIFEVRHKSLKAQIFPHDTIDTKPLYEQIRDNGKYIEYQVNASTYALIKGFHKRQSIQWPSTSHLPLPPAPFLELIPAKIRKLNRSSMSPLSELTEPSRRVELVELNRISRISGINKEHYLSIDNLKNLKKLFKDETTLINHLLRFNFTKDEITKALARK